MDIRQQTVHGVSSRAAGPATAMLLAMCAALAPVPAAAQTARPAAVTDSAIARGKEVYQGPANCAACHGPAGAGTENGPSLVDGEWLRGAGSYDEILQQVAHGTPRRNAKTGKPMPMRGWIPTSDADVRAVAAYVWALSHGVAPAKP